MCSHSRPVGSRNDPSVELCEPVGTGILELSCSRWAGTGGVSRWFLSPSLGAAHCLILLAALSIGRAPAPVWGKPPVRGAAPGGCPRAAAHGGEAGGLPGASVAEPARPSCLRIRTGPAACQQQGRGPADYSQVSRANITCLPAVSTSPSESQPARCPSLQSPGPLGNQARQL